MSVLLEKLQGYHWNQILDLLKERRVQYGVIAGVLGAYLLRRLLTSSKYRLPPGPRGWPLLGNLTSLTTMRETNKNFKKWRQQYGDVFTVYLGPKPCVILTTAEVIREAFVTKGYDFGGRMSIPSLDDFTEGGKDIAFAQPSQVWKLQRQIAHSAIRKYASGINLERNLENSMESFVTAVSRQPDGVVDIPDEMMRMLYNFFATVCFGRLFEYDDPWLNNFQRMLKEAMDKIGSGFISDFIPALRFLDSSKLKILERGTLEFRKLIDEEIEEHRKIFDPNHTRDLTDEILLQLNKQEESPESNPILAQFEPGHFRQILFDIFFGGTDTSRVTLAATVGLLMQYPEVQAKLHKELDSVLGDTGRVTLKNKDQLPYTNAVLHESMRIETAVPIGLPHETTTDTTLRNYTIPKGTTVMPHVYGVQHDPENFENPEEFNPDRWIDENGKFKYHPYKFIPFSMGPRVCLGEALAKVDLHVFTAMLFHKYEFRPIDGKPFVLKTRDIQLAIQIAPFKAKVIDRH